MSALRALAALVLAGGLVGCQAASPPPVQAGRVDLRPLGLGQTIELRGDWDWYPEVFVDPSAPLPEAPTRVAQPGLAPVGARYGSLVLAIDAEVGTLSLRLPTPSSAAAFFWNGQSLASIGTPGTSVETHRAVPGHRVVTVTTPGRLVVHVSSFELASPGLAEAVVVGPPAAVEARRTTELGGSLLLVSFLGFFALYHVLLYLFWPRDRAPLFLGLCALLLGLRSVYTGALPVLLVWPDATYEGALRVIYGALFGAGAAWIAYLRVLFPNPFRRVFWPLALGGFLALSGLVVVLPLGGALPLATLGLGAAVLVVTASVVLVIREAAQGDENAPLVAAGAVFLAAFGVQDYLNEAQVIQTAYLLPVGMAFFLLFQAVSIVRRFSQAFQSVEHLSEELRRSFLEAERRLKITKVYTRHSLVEIIEKGGDPTAFLPEARRTAVLFSDIRDFTKLTERLDPRQTVRFLNSYFAAMNACIDREGGEVDKLIGDGIMALFADPDAALRAALAMRRNLGTLNHDPSAGLVLDNGIGINYGEVVLGNLGSASKMDYTVIGDIVNSASRLESLTRHYGAQVIVADDLVRVLRSSYHLRFIDRILVKGKTQATEIYEVYDHLTDDEIQRRQAAGVIEAEAFSRYQRGDFVGAQELYGDLIRATGLGPGSACVDPVLDFWYNRCHLLETRRQKGLIEAWSGVWEFAAK